MIMDISLYLAIGFLLMMVFSSIVDIGAVDIFLMMFFWPIVLLVLCGGILYNFLKDRGYISNP